MQHAKYMEERRAIRSRVARELHVALQHLQQARAFDLQFALGLELPPERPFIDAIAHCAAAHKQEASQP